MNQVVLINAGKIIINQSTAEFNRVSRQNYKVITEDNPCAMQILQKQKISFTPKDDYLVVRQKDIFTIQDELFKNRLHLQEMLPLEANFENIIVNILDRERGKNDAH
ncbi:hypothetical protein EQ500_03760 [Lactobacillus sp. XV13L]|nr:hypothetical protein [Lactobacillus sp. XV13L]